MSVKSSVLLPEHKAFQIQKLPEPGISHDLVHYLSKGGREGRGLQTRQCQLGATAQHGQRGTCSMPEYNVQMYCDVLMSGTEHDARQ